MKNARIVLLAMLLVLAGAAPGMAAWTLVDDFEGLSIGPVTGQTAADGQVWNSRSYNTGATVPAYAVEALDGGQALVVQTGIDYCDKAWIDLPIPIAEGTIATLYCRVKLINGPATGAMLVHYGGYDNVGEKNEVRTAGCMGVKNNHTAPATYIMAGSGTNYSANLDCQMDQWYECWMVIDMTAESSPGVPDPAGYFYHCYVKGPGFSGIYQFEATTGTKDFLFRAYNAGSGILSFAFMQPGTVSAKDVIAFDDIYVDYTGENFISAYEIKKLAHDPTPSVGEVDVPQATTLSWYTGLADVTDPASWATSGITHHHVYMSSGNPSDPNLVYKTTIAAGAQTGSWTPPTLSMDGVYYWRVDEGFNSNPTDSGVLKGDVWVFDVIHSMPAITEQPQTVAADVGSNPQFHVAATNPLTGDATGLNYKWYNATTGLPLSNGTQFSNTATDTLTVLDAQPGDDMLVFCKVTMATGSTDSASAGMGVKNRLTYWTFDAAKYSGAAHADEEGFQPAIPATTGTATFTTGADGTANGALVVNADNWCTAGSFVPNEYSGEMSISLWVKWAGTPTQQYLIAKRKADGSSHFHCGGLSSTSGAFKIRTSLTGDYVVSPGLTAEQWDHVVFTVANYDGDTKRVRIYLNGLEQLDEPTFLFGEVLDAVITIGSLDDAGVSPLSGAMDDVAIYNYALTPTEVAALYSAINGPYCVEYPSFDFDQSCVVDLVDFALFAAQWLDCNIFPTCLTTIP